ncbi:MAG: hypothetical protein H6933_07680 [Burkholderiaceae bacterium]|nr:hypothetical protein [Burkholderiaceae bacterium]
MARPDPQGLPPHARATFEALRLRFAAGLGARQAEIDAATDAVGRAAALHRLAGAAGGYGFADIDAAARHALALLERGAQGPALDDALLAVRRLVLQHAPG